MNPNEFPLLRLVDSQEAKEPFQATKWLKVPVLLDTNEMKSLFQELGNFWIFPVGSVTNRINPNISHETFLDIYGDYVNALKNGKIPDQSAFRPFFSSVFTTSTDSLFAIAVNTDKQLIKVAKPVVQLQIHRIDYSVTDGKFRSMILGPETIFWGIQFSYPQLTQNENYDIISVTDSPEFPNTHLFRLIQRWIRHNTTPTPFFVNDQKTNVPVRLGKGCYSWINNHPQLVSKHIKVDS